MEANGSTSLLATTADIEAHRLKTRVVAAALEGAGFRTRLLERAFDDKSAPRPDEPQWAVAGFDAPAPRRSLDEFVLAVDVGLGAGTTQYLDILMHAFPGPVSAAESFPSAAAAETAADARAYRDLATQAIAGGASEAEALCGMTALAGAAVAASFVGAVAATIAVAELLRALIGGPRFSAVSVSLRDHHNDAAQMPPPAGIGHPGFDAAGEPSVDPA